MRYTNPQNIWALSPEQIKRLQPGQWVFAGEDTTRGQFLGTRASGSVVVAWYDNARAQRSYRAYVRALRTYSLN